MLYRKLLARPFAGALLALSCVMLTSVTALRAQDAGNRGVADSSVQTLVGGNIGDGSTTPTSVPLISLQGGVTRDSAGAIYFTESNRILKLAGGTLSVFAGSSSSGYSEATKGAGARFNIPTLLTIDPSNNVYVYDSSNARIRKIAPDGTTATVAGNGATTTGIADIGRPAVDARMPGVNGIAANAGGDVFFISNTTSCLYKVTASTGLLSIVAGNGSTGALATGAVAANNPLGGNTFTGLALLGDGTPIYATTNAIRNIKADGTNAVIAGVLDVNPASGTFNLPATQSPLFPDDGTKNALQTYNSASGTPPNVIGNVGGISPTSLSVDGATIYFLDLGVRRIRSFTVGGTIQTVFGERSEGGFTTAGGFRGNNSPAATNTPRLGVVVTAGPDNVLAGGTTPGGDDVIDNTSRPGRIFSGPNGIANAPTLTSDDVLAVPTGTAVADDQTPRNDDPKLSTSVSITLVAAGGVVTFSDVGNSIVRQFTVGGNVTTVAGATVPFRNFNVTAPSAINFQSVSDSVAVPATNAAIFAPNQVAHDAAGNVYFDADDAISGGKHKIYKYDAAAKTVTCIAGPALTNGFPTNGGDGGPAANALLTGLGSQLGVLADGTVLFADSVVGGVTTHTVRAVSPAGVLSTIAGIPTVSGNKPPDLDLTLVNAAGAPVVTNRVGQKPLAVPFNHPDAAVGTTVNDFAVADTNNGVVVIVAGGVITQEINPGVSPVYMTQIGTNVFVAGAGSNQVSKINLSTTPATVTAGFIPAAAAGTVNVTGDTTNGSAIFTNVSSTAGLSPGDTLNAAVQGIPAGSIILAVTLNTITMNASATASVAANAIAFTHNVGGNVRGLAGGTNGLFVLGANGSVTLYSTASLSTGAGAVQYLFAATANPTTGLAVSGTTVAFAETAGGSGFIKQFTDTGSISPAPTVSIVAGSFTNVVSNGFNLQAHLTFSAFSPLAISGTKFISGDDAVKQIRLITPGIPAPNSTATVFAGAGSERNGGLDGEPALNAADISSVGGIAVDSTGAVFFSDQSVNTIRSISGGTINTIAGVPGVTLPSTSTVVDGPALNTFFSKPAGLAFNGADASALFVCDQSNNVVRKISPTDGTGTVTRFAGVVGDGAGAGGDQSTALTARLDLPVGCVFDGAGNLYIADQGSSGAGKRVHVVSKAGIMTQLGGGGANIPTYLPIPAIETDFAMTGIAIDTGGKVYLPNGQCFITRIAGGNAQLVVGDPLIQGFNGDGLSGYNTLLKQPTAATFSTVLGLVFTDKGNDRVRAVTNLGEGTNSPPVAVIAANPDHLGTAPFKVVLNGTGSTDDDGDIVTYEWDFGDGTKGYGPSVEKVYPTMGAYPVTLTVTDTAGNTSTAALTVFSALPLLASDTTGKGSFTVGFAKKAGNDSFSIQLKGVHSLKNETGKPFTCFIGPFSATGTIGGKGVKPPKKPKPQVSSLKGAKASITCSLDPTKGTVSVAVKGANLGPAFKTFGVNNENSIGGRTATVPIVLTINNGDLVIGDKLLFPYKSKYNSSAQGKFSQ